MREIRSEILITERLADVVDTVSPPKDWNSRRSRLLECEARTNSAA
jgi:hypothetical protein